ncbi:MAG: DoxX family membrane protein [Saprospiraceae bacterium]|jgi:putative oxidoreductase|uniref:DoxX family protein n=1 Tax=Candidatus Brachybacter algidus TaxID=2982024 RepID=UPI001DE0EC2F|nr:DoxX family membrane protein [Candidatus Brachybacter algidus]MBK6450923.1 DoxX family membrane protein [Candidatus Brachybacter algidus]MBK7605034.1 DoxX family membrane protein [Candidatus Brachybacter algidus]MBK8355068.1 DoxX family membrane protein [Candidatus Brachybacter algidus]MBK8842327.1 DoxX family membrane protein [Candidatus Brachybacter algidus]MBK9022708.1 DoxX family membrane protein [Candidatus Brachybacter algidus]
MNNLIVLRIAIAIILLSHGIPGMFDNGINDFGNLYLNQVGFAPFGVAIAWAIKISHVVCAVLLLLNKYIVAAGTITIIILIAGIVMVHYPEGWFVVGGGRNGMEYNFLLIAVIVSLMLPHILKINK